MSTTPNNQSDNEELHPCEVCNAFSYFKQLIREDEDLESAFHEAFDNALDAYTETLAKEAYSVGYEDGLDDGIELSEEAHREGFLDGMKIINEQISKTIEHLEDEDSEDIQLNDWDESEEECDCPDCSPNLYSIPCDTCDCEDECEDVEMKIRRRIWEDVD